MSIKPAPKHGGKQWVGGDLICYGDDVRSDAMQALTVKELWRQCEEVGATLNMLGQACGDVHRWATEVWREGMNDGDYNDGYYDALCDVLARFADVTCTLGPGLAKRAEVAAFAARLNGEATS